MLEEEEEMPFQAKGLNLKAEQGWGNTGRVWEGLEKGKEDFFFAGGGGDAREMLRKLGKEDCGIFVVYYNVLR